MKSCAQKRSGRQCVVAMVLGSALSVCGVATPAQADETAVNNLSRYCTACWRNARLPFDRWNDCTQEVFCRLLEQVPRQRWPELLKEESEDRRQLLRAIDAVKKRAQRERQRYVALPSDIPDSTLAIECQRDDDREAWRHVAAQVLTGRQREILHKSSAGWSIQNLAQEMNLTPERVSDEKYKAIRKMQRHFAI